MLSGISGRVVEALCPVLRVLRRGRTAALSPSSGYSLRPLGQERTPVWLPPPLFREKEVSGR